jgi:RNA polymerase sigma factor (sigma-70 family)
MAFYLDYCQSRSLHFQGVRSTNSTVTPIRATQTASIFVTPLHPEPLHPGGSERATADTPEQEGVAERLFRDHNRALIRYLLTRLDSEHEARDVAQEAYVRLLQLDTPGAISFLRAYLFKIATNIAVDRVRHKSMSRRAHDDIVQRAAADCAPSAERSAIAHEELATIERALNELPPKCKYAFCLHRFSDRSIHEIATLMGVSKRMVHLYLKQALVHCQASVADPAAKRMGN